MFTDFCGVYVELFKVYTKIWLEIDLIPGCHDCDGIKVFKLIKSSRLPEDLRLTGKLTKLV